MSDTAEVKTANMETHSALPPEETERLGSEIVAALKTVFDPEIPVNIYELGLIYKVDLKDDRGVDVMMTLTTPNCPAAGELPTMVENAVASVPGVVGRLLGGRLRFLLRRRLVGLGVGLDPALASLALQALATSGIEVEVQVVRIKRRRAALHQSSLPPERLGAPRS